MTWALFLLLLLLEIESHVTLYSSVCDCFLLNPLIFKVAWPWIKDRISPSSPPSSRQYGNTSCGVSSPGIWNPDMNWWWAFTPATSFGCPLVTPGQMTWADNCPLLTMHRALCVTVGPRDCIDRLEFPTSLQYLGTFLIDKLFWSWLM